MEKGKFPKQVIEMALSRALPAPLCTWRGEAAGMQELSESFTQAELQQEPLFQLHIPDPMPRFSSGSVIHLSEQAGC